MPDATPRHPIVYVRGYAMSRGEIDSTTADPFCGFNLGSTVYRATPDKKQPPRKFIFESPVVRLGTDFGYQDVFVDGVDIMDADWPQGRPIPMRSIVVYRYYDEASTLLGKGKTPEIETFARGLGDLILKVRSLVLAHPECTVTRDTFRVHLVAHSMGGLVCRAFLQNPALGKPEARAAVDKFFTYATPHNGIELAGLNVPEWLSANDLNNFNRDRMREYLDLKAVAKQTGRVDWLPEDRFPIERVFCLVGTNRQDYEVAHGMSRTFAGHGSDGLVRIENASVWGIDRAGATTPCATAYTYRSHSGFFGIVNSEEGYQNLIRFLFGDVRIDVVAEIDSVRLPRELKGKTVDALYQFEVQASPRGKRWMLTRRMAEEDSVACLRHKDLAGPDAGGAAKEIYLSTLFLANVARVDPTRKSLACALYFAVRVPDYEVEKRFWPNGHFEGRYLYRETFTVELEPPAKEGGRFRIGYAAQSENLASSLGELDARRIQEGKTVLRIPFGRPATEPGLSGSLRLTVSGWNR
ncbi:MAG TPA: hypothetical protein VJV75_14030 [Candidatus Polarisedimenticolia bacterium]|nr:hypothetical protein [Candidatus Polarisedimenticolia bacterium]